MQTSWSEDDGLEDDMISEEMPKEIEVDNENNDIDLFANDDELDCISEEEK